MVIKRGELRLKPRQLGIAGQDITAGEFGTALFEKKPGSGQYFEFEVKAVEYVRENHEVWVVDNNNGITEHTPQELRFDTYADVPRRVTERYPLPTTHNHEKWGYKEYTGASTRDDISDGLTSPHDLAPDTDLKLITQDIIITVTADSTVTIEGGDGSTYYIIHKGTYNAGGGIVIRDLGVKLNAAGDKFYVTVTAGTVRVTITADQEE